MTEQYPEVVDAIEELFRGFTDLDDMSDDWGLQFISEANEVNRAGDVPREDRVDVIISGIRQHYTRSTETELENFRWQLEMMYSLS